MKTISLDALTDKCRLRGKLRGFSGLTADDWRSFINDAIAWAWPAVTGADTGYGVAVATLIGDGVTSALPLPADHMSTRAVFRGIGSGIDRRAEFVGETWFRDNAPDGLGNIVPPGVYWYGQTTIELRPIGGVGEEITMRYVTTPPVLVNGTDTIDVVVNWDNALVDWAIGAASPDPAQAARFQAMAQSLLDTTIARWGQRRDRGPDFIARYKTRRPRGGVFGW